MEEGEAYLTADMADALRATLRYCPMLATEPEGLLAAIVDFTFNLRVGRLQASTLRRRVPIGGGAWSGKDFLKADRAGGTQARRLAKMIVQIGLSK